jgi:putative aldouronate transport system permease protein
MHQKSDAYAYYLMILPGVVLLVLFTFVPLFYSVIAFQNFTPARGIANSPFVGLDNFLFLFRIRDARDVFVNTLTIAVGKILLILFSAITFALLLNEVRFARAKRAIQTMVYLPHFLSWVILAGIMRTLLAREGLVNEALGFLGVDPVPFLGRPATFPWVIIVSDAWKEFGFEAIIYLAALTGIDPTLYEVAELDGANRFQKMWYDCAGGLAEHQQRAQRRLRPDLQPLQPHRLLHRRRARHLRVPHRPAPGPVQHRHHRRPAEDGRLAGAHRHLLLGGQQVRQLPDLLGRAHGHRPQPLRPPA